MCGISGFLERDRTRTEGELRATAMAMAETLAHRGPDDQGVWVDARSGLGFGFRRLSILDLSETGHQPMASCCGRFVLEFNGEIYNHRELREELSLAPGDLRGTSDTEVLLAAISRWGVRRTLERSNGMFALAVWDAGERTLTLARDRMGEKPLYYGWQTGAFLFASELKALRPHPHFHPQVDRDALTLFFRHNYVPSPHSIYQGIRKLPPGTMLTVSAATPDPEPTPYWSLAEAVHAGIRGRLRIDDAEAVELLEDELLRAVQLRMAADVPLGAFLSGGIDSSTVVALMQAQSNDRVRTFTIGFTEADYDEGQAAAAVARHLGTEHQELYVSPADAMSVLPDLASMFDEPFADSSQIPTHLVSRLASKHVTVALSGDGGDELFGGYTRYQVLERLWRILRVVPPRARAMLADGLLRPSPEAWQHGADRLAPVLPTGLRHVQIGDKIHKAARTLSRNTSDEMFLDLVSAWTDPADVVVGGREPSTLLTAPDADVPQSGLIERAMYLDTVTYLPDDILTKVDRASMAVGVETRVPLLDHHVVELAWRLPAAQKLRRGQGKWLLRQVLARHLPVVLFDRPKQGFGVPIGAWLRGPLRDWAEELLDQQRLEQEGYLRATPVRRLWQEHLQGGRDHKYRLWGVLMFQSWVAQQRSTGGAAGSCP